MTQGHRVTYTHAVTAAAKLTLGKRRYLASFILLSVALFAAYAYLLSYFAFGILLFGNLYPIFVVLVSAAISVLLSLVLTLTAYSLSNYRKYGKRAGLPALAVMLSASFSLCCGAAIPSLLAVLGASAPFIISGGGGIEGFFSAAEVPFTLLSIALLLLSLYLVSRDVCVECRIKGVK